MRLAFHSRVAIDIARVVRYYEEVAGAQLASEFLRRVNLNRFPYHFLYRIAGDHIRVLVVRHHRRHPNVGLSRR
jgi:hypothetical protein